MWFDVRHFTWLILFDKSFNLPCILFFCLGCGDRDFVLVSSGMNEYTLTKEDVGCCLAFVYVPVNFQGVIFCNIILSFLLVHERCYI